ncbi:MAG: hypothetical protein WC793_01455 [Candidatus Paceibacterota bacterium]|jgi:hypothetical protein
MYFLLILFFGSLLGITFMIGRKLLLLQNGEMTYKDSAETFLKVQYLEELKHEALKNIKKHSYIGLVTAIRLYVRSSNLLKNKYQEAKVKVNEKLSKYGSRKNGDLQERQEVNKFLKMISDYKYKIRAIKHKIKEEEENL